MREASAPAVEVWALGLTQVVGYGTLYYSFSILAPGMAAEFDLPLQWVFGALSASLFIGSALAPTAGRLADRVGAARLMTIGSVAASLALAACALAPGRVGFLLALVAMQVASCFVLYATAFVALVQVAPSAARSSITNLTLIAGFTSTIFWPVTATLSAHLAWREVYLLFAAMNVLICLPVHAWLMHRSTKRKPAARERDGAQFPGSIGVQRDPARMRALTMMMLAAFALEGFVLSAVLIHMVPLITAAGVGSAGVFVASLFGPAQVASRLVNKFLGGGLRQAVLAVMAASFLAIGLAVLALTAPSLPGAAAFAILFGLGSGLTSIVNGTLPLELFGSDGYGARLGWISAARQFTSSFAPFALAFAMAQTSVGLSLWALVAVASAGLVSFAMIARRAAQR